MLKNEEKSRFVHQVFENIADKYDLMNSLLSFNRHKTWRAFTMKKMAMQYGDSAIDVCTGTGDWAISMAKITGENSQIVGLDFSKNMLDIAEKKIKQKELKQVKLVLGDAMQLPYPDNTFDYATIGFALRNVPDIRQVLKEMTRVVKPGGKVISLELSKPSNKIFRSVYYFYFYRILPFIGKIIADKYQEYAWLPESLTNFPDRFELAKIFADVGLENVKVYPLTFGIAALHIGQKSK